MRRVYYKIAVVASIVALIFSACEGPQGPMGNADVSSGTLTLVDSDWQSDYYDFETSDGTLVSRPALTYSMSLSQLTESILDSGMVLVYYRVVNSNLSDPNTYEPLPTKFTSFNTEYTHNIRYKYDVGTIELYYYYSDNDASDSNTPPDISNQTLPDMQIKWVLASSSAVSSMVNAGVDLSDYHEVRKAIQ